MVTLNPVNLYLNHYLNVAVSNIEGVHATLSFPFLSSAIDCHKNCMEGGQQHVTIQYPLKHRTQSSNSLGKIMVSVQF